MYIPSFSITSEITNILIEIEKRKQKIDIAKMLPQQVVRLRQRATVDEVFSSTSIEGNQLNKHQVEQVISGKINSREYAVIEVANYKKAHDWVQKSKNHPINDTTVLMLHNFIANDLLPVSKTGQYRKNSIFIVDLIDGKEIIRYEGPSSGSVKGYLDALYTWINNENKLHPILKAAILHYEFVSIHPFSDGNGRVTRLLVKQFLKNSNYFFRGALDLDSFYLENRLSYYDELNNAVNYKEQRIADLNDWIVFFLNGFISSVDKLTREVAILSKVDSHSTIDFSEEDVIIIDYIANFGSINSTDVKEMFKLEERTAQRRLKKLLDAGVLVKKGAARTSKYELKK